MNERHGRRGEAIGALARKIATLIAEQNLPPHTHLASQSLADRFRSSRTPIVHALGILQASKVVYHLLNRGFFVSPVVETDERSKLCTDPLEALYERIIDDKLRHRLPDVMLESHLRSRYGLNARQLAAILARISAEGWMVRRGGYGWEFTEQLTTPEALAQTFRVRKAIEPAALLEPGYRLDRARADHCLAVEHDLLAGGLRSKTAEELFMRGTFFHETIVEGSRNPYMIEIARRMNRLRRLFAYKILDRRRQGREHCQEHIAILEHLLSGRNRDAAESLRVHLASSQARYEEVRDVLDGVSDAAAARPPRPHPTAAGRGRRARP